MPWLERLLCGRNLERLEGETEHLGEIQSMISAGREQILDRLRKSDSVATVLSQSCCTDQPSALFSPISPSESCLEMKSRHESRFSVN
jgi:hypothetical protein